MRFRGFLVVAIVFASTVEAAEDGKFAVDSNLKAAAAKVDVTPPEGTVVVGHPRKTNGTRDPLRSGILLLDDGKTKAAIVTFDLLGAEDVLVNEVREAIFSKTGTPRENVMVTVSHNHSGPDINKEVAWRKDVVARIAKAVEEAAARMKPVTLGYAEDKIEFGINRRKVINNKAVVRLNPDGPNDKRVKVLRFDDGSSLTPLAVIMHAVCHPCFFTWGDNASRPYPTGYPKVSADFPGEAQTFVEKVYDGQTKAMFLQGCAGDIRPNLPGYPYRCADEADIQWAGRELGGATVRALSRSVIREELSKRKPIYKISVASNVVELPGKDGPVRAELMAMKIGPYLFLTMPGEPMVEYGFRIEKSIADRAIPIVVGYANGDIGYIATAQAHRFGGYEPTQSNLVPQAEAVIYRELDRLADQVVGDVFETFNKHPSDVKLRKPTTP